MQSIRAAGILLSGEWVLLHRRVSQAVWALPGGKVELGESAAQALVRELAEELSISVVCGELVYVAENFFTLAGARAHECCEHGERPRCCFRVESDDEAK